MLMKVMQWQHFSNRLSTNESEEFGNESEEFGNS